MFLLPFRLTFDPAIEIANITVRLLVRINFVNLFADSVEYRERWDHGSDENLRENRHHDGVRHIYRGHYRVAKAIVDLIAATTCSN